MERWAGQAEKAAASRACVIAIGELAGQAAYQHGAVRDRPFVADKRLVVQVAGGQLDVGRRDVVVEVLDRHVGVEPALTLVVEALRILA